MYRKKKGIGIHIFGPCGTDCKAVISYVHIIHKPAWKLCCFHHFSCFCLWLLLPLFFFFGKKWKRQQVRYKRCVPERKPSQLFLYIRMTFVYKSTYSPSHLKSTCRTIAHLCFRDIKHNRWVNHYLLWVVNTELIQHFSEPVLQSAAQQNKKRKRM